MKRGERPRDDAAEEAEFGPRLEAARELMRRHFGIVEIRTDRDGRIVGRTDSAMAKRRAPRMHPKAQKREPRIFKSPFPTEESSE